MNESAFSRHLNIAIKINIILAKGLIINKISIS